MYFILFVLQEAVQQTTSGQQSLTPSSGMPAPSPGGTSSAADESLEDSKSLPGASPNPWPHTPSQMSQGHVSLCVRVLKELT